MLYYLKVEVLGDAAGEALEGMSARYRKAKKIRCQDMKLAKTVGNKCRNEHSFFFQVLSYICSG